MGIAAKASDALPVRAEILSAFDVTWERTARPGTWWSGTQRVAIARATRRARSCAFCVERRQALSPYAVEGEHDSDPGLPAALVDAVHRISGRLSRRFYEEVLEAGIAPELYVEAVGVAVRTLNVDAFHYAAGLPPRPLPEPLAGDPSQRGPDGAVEDGAWVRMLPLGHPFWRGWQAPNVMRALSLVPDEVTDLMALARAEYLGPDQVADASYDPGRAISRAQIELIAGRVSSISECFY